MPHPNPQSPIPTPHHMQHAIRMARRHIGNTGHRPSVGCVLVKDGQIIAAACTGLNGAPHAEARALELAGEAARGATAYVTLEPCAHHGNTPPCAEALIQAGITHVFIACTDPDPRVAGKGIAMLEAAGIHVETGLCETEARDTLAGFFTWLEHKRPYVTLKLATSADGVMAVRKGENPTITGEQARARGQLLRSQHDAILTGIGTVLADNPLLTCRLAGLETRSPIRVVLDRNGQMREDSQLAKTAGDVPLWVMDNHGNFLRGGNADAAVHTGRDAHADGLPRSRCSLARILTTLAEHNITRLMIEAGPTLTRAFLEAGLVDEVQHFCAPSHLANIAHLDLPVLDIPALAQHYGLVLKREEMLGKDVLRVYGVGYTV